MTNNRPGKDEAIRMLRAQDPGNLRDVDEGSYRVSAPPSPAAVAVAAMAIVDATAFNVRAYGNLACEEDAEFFASCVVRALEKSYQLIPKEQETTTKTYLQVHVDENGDDYRFSVYEDVAELFWPRDFSHGNYDAEERVVRRMLEKGCERVRDRSYPFGAYRTPAGLVAFDSESGGMEWHSRERGPVEYVVQIVKEIQAKMDDHRAALA